MRIRILMLISLNYTHSYNYFDSNSIYHKDFEAFHTPFYAPFLMWRDGKPLKRKYVAMVLYFFAPNGALTNPLYDWEIINTTVVKLFNRLEDYTTLYDVHYKLYTSTYENFEHDIMMAPRYDVATKPMPVEDFISLNTTWFWLRGMGGFYARSYSVGFGCKRLRPTFIISLKFEPVDNYPRFCYNVFFALHAMYSQLRYRIDAGRCDFRLESDVEVRTSTQMHDWYKTNQIFHGI